MKNKWLGKKDIIASVKGYSVYSALEYISVMSLDIFLSGKNSSLEEMYLVDRDGNITDKFTKEIFQFELAIASFYFIKYGDYNGTYKINNANYSIVLSIIKDLKLFLTCQVSKKNKFIKMQELLLFFCMCIEMKDLMDIEIEYTFNRYYYICTCLNSGMIDNIDDIFNCNYGLALDKCIKLYLLIISIAMTYSITNIADIIDNYEVLFDKLNISKKQVLRFVSKNSKKINFYSRFDNWNILKYNPIVHYKNEGKDIYLISNFASMLINFSEFIYWTIRDYYKDKNSDVFLNAIGGLFERYLNELFNYYEIPAKKIEEGKRSVPDWIFETDEFVFLVEQKSALMQLGIKDSTNKNCIMVLADYIHNNIYKAFTQLFEYSNSLSKRKQVIKICLTLERNFNNTSEYLFNLPLTNFFENYFSVQLIGSIEGAETYWIINIDDFERMLCLYNCSKSRFNKLIYEYLEIKKETIENSNKSTKSFRYLLDKYNAGNDFINKKMNYYKSYYNDINDMLKQN